MRIQIVVTTAVFLMLISGCKKDANSAKSGQQLTEEAAPIKKVDVDADIKKACKTAFDNTVTIAEKDKSTAKEGIDQLRANADKTVAACVEESKKDEKSAEKLKCIAAAKSTTDLLSCHKKPDGKNVGSDASAAKTEKKEETEPAEAEKKEEAEPAETEKKASK